VDFHGRGIAPAVAEAIAEELKDSYEISVFHYDLIADDLKNGVQSGNS
jgi:flavodoxin